MFQLLHKDIKDQFPVWCCFGFVDISTGGLVVLITDKGYMICVRYSDEVQNNNASSISEMFSIIN